MLILALLAAATPEPASQIAVWETTEKVSQMDGTTSFFASIHSNENVTGILDKPNAAHLVIACDKGRSTVMFSWPDFIDADPTTSGVAIRWRLDDGKIKTTWMRAVTDAVAFSNPSGIAFLREAANAKKLLVSVPDRHGGQEASFDISGIGTVIDRLHALKCE